MSRAAGYRLQIFAPHLVVSVLVLVAPVMARAQTPPTSVPEDRDPSSTSEIRVTMPGSDEVMRDPRTTGRTETLPRIPVEQPVDPRLYVCGSGDILELNFWGRQNLLLRVNVDLEGRVFVPRIGYVKIAGKTLAQARDELKRLVLRYYPNVSFDLSLASPREFVVHVANHVEKPGPYIARPLERVSVVLAKAQVKGGSRRRVELRHRDGRRSSADLLLYDQTGDPAYNPYVLDGDIIEVPALGVEVHIAGPVRRQGSYELKTGDLGELVALAGGFETSASRRLPIRVIRRDDKEQSRVIELPMPRLDDPKPPVFALRDDDQVVIPSTEEVQRGVTVVGATTGSDPSSPSPTVKRLSFVAGETVRVVLQRAGGVAPFADLGAGYIQRGQGLVPLDLEALLVRGELNADVEIKLGDVVVVPQKQRFITVDGAVLRAGIVQYNPTFGIDEYLARAGGLTRNAQSKENISVITPRGDVKRYSRALRLGPGDGIVVPERTYSRSELVQTIISTAGLLLSGVAVVYSITR